MQKHLGLNPEAAFYFLEELKKWKSVPAGTRPPKTVMLFPRIETAAPPAAPRVRQCSPAPAAPIKPEITLDDLRRIDLRGGRDRAEGGTGAEGEKTASARNRSRRTRTIVAGIAALHARGPDRPRGDTL